MLSAGFLCWESIWGLRHSATRSGPKGLFDSQVGPAMLDEAFGTSAQSKKWQDDSSAKEPECPILKNF